MRLHTRASMGKLEIDIHHSAGVFSTSVARLLGICCSWFSSLNSVRTLHSSSDTNTIAQSAPALLPKISPPKKNLSTLIITIQPTISHVSKSRHYCSAAVSPWRYKDRAVNGLYTRSCRDPPPRYAKSTVSSLASRGRSSPNRERE